MVNDYETLERTYNRTKENMKYARERITKLASLHKRIDSRQAIRFHLSDEEYKKLTALEAEYLMHAAALNRIMRYVKDDLANLDFT